MKKVKLLSANDDQFETVLEYSEEFVDFKNKICKLIQGLEEEIKLIYGGKLIDETTFNLCKNAQGDEICLLFQRTKGNDIQKIDEVKSVELLKFEGAWTLADNCERKVIQHTVV